MGALLPRDFLERQPKRWQKDQRKRRVLGTLKKMKVKREKVVANATRQAERLAGIEPEKKWDKAWDKDDDRALSMQAGELAAAAARAAAAVAARAAAAKPAAAATAAAAAAAPSHSTPIGPHGQGLWAAELNPYQPLVVRIPEGVQLCLMRASLAAGSSARGGSGGNNGGGGAASTVRCRTPATKLPATLCVLQPLFEESCGLSTLFSSRDKSCALAVEGPDAVHVVGCYMRPGGGGAQHQAGQHHQAGQQPAGKRRSYADNYPAEEEESESYSSSEDDDDDDDEPPAKSAAAPKAKAKAPAAKPAAGAAASAAGPRLVELPEGLKYADVKPGSGRRAMSGNKLTLRYTGLAPDAKAASGWREFDSNNGKAFHFTLGSAEVIRGWEVGLVGMRCGGTRRLVVPSNLGYGEAGAGPIPPRATLIFEISLMNVV